MGAAVNDHDIKARLLRGGETQVDSDGHKKKLNVGVRGQH